MEKCAVRDHRKIRAPAIKLALLSALLFDASTPFAKLVLGNGVSPWLPAGLH